MAWRERWPLLFLPSAALLLYLIDPNNDLVGSADLYHGKHSALFAAAFDWSAAELTSPSYVIAKLLQTAYAVLFYPHGPLPPLYFGLIYKLYAILGLSVTPALLQAPTAALATLTVAVMTWVLRAHGLRNTAICGAILVLAASPAFVAASRGLGTYWVVAIPFNQALLLAALVYFRSGRKGGAWMLGLALAHALLSDVLAFLVIGTLVLADSLRRLDCLAGWSPLRLWRGVRRELGGWLVGPVMGSALLASAIPVIGLAIFLALRGKTGLPLYPILPFWAFFAHGSQLGEPNTLSAVLTRLVLLMGDGFPILLGLVLLGLARGCGISTGDHRRLRLFAVLCLTGFGLLFYVLTENHPANRYYYQQYLLVPVSIGVGLALQRLGACSAGLRLLSLGCMAVVALGLFVGTAALVWKRPLSLLSDQLVVDEAWDPAGDSIGIRRPDYGHRAAGYVVRTLLLDAWSRQDQPAEISFGSTVAWKYFEPFMLYAGLFQRGDWFAERLGRHPIYSASMLARSQGWSAFACDDGARYCIATLDPTTDRWTNQPLPADQPLPSCGAQFCVSMRFGTGDGPVSEWWIVDGQAGDEKRYRIQVRGVEAPALPPGTYDRRDLETRFSASWPTVWDYFPRRSNDRVAALVDGLFRR